MVISEEDVAGLGNANILVLSTGRVYGGIYLRALSANRYWLINGNPHVSDDQPLAADHLIIQYADMDVLDDKGRLSFKCL